MSNSIHISELSKEISNVVKSYSKEVELEAGEATELVAKETVQELKRSSPKRSGKYARNWTKRKQGPTGQIVFQKDPTYRLTHLLENGHALKRGGRTIGKVKGQPHIAIAEENAVSSLEKELNPETGEITYGTPVHFPGAVELSIEPSGDLIKFKADNVDYYTSPNNQGYDGTYTCARIPEDFAVDILGEKVDDTDKVQTEYANAETSPFALMFQFEGDKTATRHVLYYCTANRPTVGSTTMAINYGNKQLMESKN